MKRAIIDAPEAAPRLDINRFIETLAEERGLDVDVIITTLEAALSSAYKKYQAGNQNIEIKIDRDSGGIIINEIRNVVENVENPDTEITLKDALMYDINSEIGGTVKIRRNPADFGRIAAQTARQVITQRLRDEERKIVFNEFADKVGELVTGTIYRNEGDQTIIQLNDRTDGVLTRKEKIPNERYNIGSMMKFYVLDVKQTARSPKIMLSRTHPGLLRKLMEVEIPEIQQGIIEIKSIVRDAGARAKVSLVTLDPNVDPVGACVGNGGARIKAISSALKGEKIDVIVYTEDPLNYIRAALSPAQIAKVEPVLDTERSAIAYVYQDQLSLAIGKLGQNVRLAAKLTGWKIDIKTIEPDRMPTLKDIFHDVFNE